jgi:hypothetical protein
MNEIIVDGVTVSLKRSDDTMALLDLPTLPCLIALQRCLEHPASVNLFKRLNTREYVQEDQSRRENPKLLVDVPVTATVFDRNSS